ncbi:MAG: hypothetical protein DRH97_00200 [Chloroflexi bacterium]|nr:MAG: hypothetical protein DRH97_00200 [Chloroflexota bacterium]
MRIKITKNLDYRTEIDKVETFEAGKEYDVSDAVGKSIIHGEKAVKVEVKSEAAAKTEPIKDAEIKPEETKIVEPEVKKEEAPKTEKKKADKKK